MRNLLKRMFKFLKENESEPLIKILIHKSSLLHNLNEFRNKYPEKTIVPVLKSNAYGHGILEIAEILKNEVDIFVIDSYFEATKLRSNGIKNTLLIIGYVRPECINNSKIKNISYTITSIEALKEIKSKVNIHLKFDTGMHRQGILISEIDDAFNLIRNNSNIHLEGICSHLADSDNTNTDFSLKQINLWNEIVNRTRKEFPNTKYFHLSNTHGHKFSNIIDSNVNRLGIGLYGITRFENMDLKPVLEMNTIVASIKNIKAGDFVGYNNTFKADKDITIATIPLGYYEGLDRNLSNKGFVKIQNIFCPIIGRISMNISTIDVSNVPNIKIGDKVQVISNIYSDLNSIENIAKITSRINYEISVKIPVAIRREIID